MTPPKDYAKQLKFRSALSKTLRDGVTTPCGKSDERSVIVKCAKVQMEKSNRELACENCAKALRDKKKGKKKGAKR